MKSGVVLELTSLRDKGYEGSSQYGVYGGVGIEEGDGIWAIIDNGNMESIWAMELRRQYVSFEN